MQRLISSLINTFSTEFSREWTDTEIANVFLLALMSLTIFAMIYFGFLGNPEWNGESFLKRHRLNKKPRN